MAAAKPLVIVGASHAGVQLADSVREQGFEDPIVMISDERHQPYLRPPLSKGLLTGKTAIDQLQLRGSGFFTQNRIDLRLGQRAASVDTNARTLTLTNGDRVDYGWLALTTGARCRPLEVPGAGIGGVVQLRTLDDALVLADAMTRTRRACIIGGGFIGLEVAAALRTRDVDVTVIESQQHLLTRSFPPIMSAYVENAHRRRGIELVIGHAVRQLHASQGHVSAVELTDGRHVDCDLVVLGVGVLPNVEIAQAAGMVVNNGIQVDQAGRTSAPHVVSAGDVACMLQPPGTGGPARVRLESVQMANDGARAAASVILGREPPVFVVPWFWSEQFELKFQMAGLPVAGDEVVIRGNIDEDKFSAFYLRGGVLVGAHSVNRPAEHMHSRKLIAARARLTREQLADSSVDLKSLPAQSH